MMPPDGGVGSGKGAFPPPVMGGVGKKLVAGGVGAFAGIPGVAVFTGIGVGVVMVTETGLGAATENIAVNDDGI